MKHEPSPVAILAARIMRAYPSLSPYSAASLATELCAIERAQRRHAERCCSGEDGGYVQRIAVPSAVNSAPRGPATWTVHDPKAEERADERVARRLFRWRSRLGELLNPCNPGETCLRTDLEVTREYRGPVLRVRFPGEPEAVAV